MSEEMSDPAARNFNLSGGMTGSILRATREPCPVCGHPTGDCTGTTPPPKTLVGLGAIETLKHAQTFYIEEDIWEELQITPGRTTRRLRYHKGQSVSREEAENLGLI